MVSCLKQPFRWKKPEKSQIVALDKTGTITSGEPRVTDLVCCNRDMMKKTLLELAGCTGKEE